MSDALLSGTGVTGEKSKAGKQSFGQVARSPMSRESRTLL
jgi:hypothetical protein